MTLFYQASHPYGRAVDFSNLFYQAIHPYGMAERQKTFILMLAHSSIPLGMHRLVERRDK